MSRGQLHVLCAAMCISVPPLLSTVHANTSTLPQGVTIAYDVPNSNATVWMSIPWTTQLDFQESVAFINRLDDHGLLISAEVVRDPSIAYQLKFTNTSDVAEPVALSLFAPVLPLQANMLSAELTVELIDSSGDGTAFLQGNYGVDGAIQAVGIADSSGGSFESLGPTLGTDMNAPGLQTFSFSPVAGPTPAEANQLNLATRFILSPGDTVNLSSRFIIDEGSGIPLAEAPAFPGPESGPYFNVINVDSPETSLADNAFIGSQTQLNLSEGGSIGSRFNFDAFMNNKLNDNNVDVEVNITGGTVGNQFMALSNTTVNVLGGTIDFVFIAGSYTDQSENVEVNISGGTVGAGGGQIQANAGSVVNITNGTLGDLRGSGGQINIAGGEVGNTDFPSLGGDIEVNVGSIVSISGGSFFDAAFSGSIIVLDGVLNVSGGTFTENKHDVDVYDDGVMNLFGSSFLIDDIPIDGLVYGEVFEVTDRDVVLSGVLADGEEFAVDLNSVNEPFGPDFVSPDAVLTVTLSLPGDYNNDGIVNAADYTVWRDALGTDSVLPHDTSPGTVSQLDYDVWKANFGRVWSGDGLASHSEPVAVPEPSSMWLFVLALAALGRARRESLRRWAPLSRRNRLRFVRMR